MGYHGYMTGTGSPTRVISPCRASCRPWRLPVWLSWRVCLRGLQAFRLARLHLVVYCMRQESGPASSVPDWQVCMQSFVVTWSPTAKVHLPRPPVKEDAD